MTLVLHTNTLLLIVVIALFFYVNSRHNLRVQRQDILVIKDQEPDYDRKIIDEPKRFYDSRYVTRKQMAVNVPTRGEPPEYQQVGYLGGTDDPENIKPLYGRQTYRGSGSVELLYIAGFSSGHQDSLDYRGIKSARMNGDVKNYIRMTPSMSMVKNIRRISIRPTLRDTFLIRRE